MNEPRALTLSPTPSTVVRPARPSSFEIRRVIVGQDAMLERVLVALLAGGHLLLEGVPGLAKTLTVKIQAPTASDLQAIYQSLGSRVGTTDETREVTQWFAAAGLALMVAGAGLAAHWFNRFP
jgi:D-arabinose 1-dehydrogenase-like Zn-dependent alcohol dehydrogenase